MPDVNEFTPRFDDLGALISFIKKRRLEGLSYERIARLFPKRITRAHIHIIYNEGWEPRAEEIRQALGLPAAVFVTPVNGSAIPAGAQVHHADHCRDCGRPYISNHPLRVRCFICGPYRGKRAKHNPRG